jgi:hypothetical protein
MKRNLFIFILLLINILVFNINIYASENQGDENVFIEHPIINKIYENINEKIGSPIETIVDLENNYLYFIYNYNESLVLIVKDIPEENSKKNKTTKVNEKNISDKFKLKNNYFAIIKKIDENKQTNFSTNKTTQNNNSNFNITNFSVSNKEELKLAKFDGNKKKKNNIFSVKQGLVNNQKKLNLKKIKKDNESKKYEVYNNKKDNNTYTNKDVKNQTKITYKDYEKYLEYLKNEYNFK